MLFGYNWPPEREAGVRDVAGLDNFLSLCEPYVFCAVWLVNRIRVIVSGV